MITVSKFKTDFGKRHFQMRPAQVYCDMTRIGDIFGS